MGVLESIRHGCSDPHRFVHRKLLLSVDAVSERLACQIGHHIEEEAIGFPGIIERQDVGVSQLRRDLNLREEALGSDNGSQFRLQDLEGHLSVVLDVGGEIDGSHAARAELTLDRVAALEGGVQTGGGIGHGAKDARGLAGRQAHGRQASGRWGIIPGSNVGLSARADRCLHCALL